jgi:energy-coupling factor transport system ATP-binding protein
MNGPDILEIADLSFQYSHTSGGESAPALDHISFSVRPGEIVILTGPSGSGKSTLLRCLNGLIPQSTRGTMTGRVMVAGKDTSTCPVHELASTVGMVFQDPDTQFFSSEVDTELAFGLEQRGVEERAMEQAIASIADLLGITHLLGRSLDQLSWGERQRVAVASVVVTGPDLLILDEPFSGLDRSGAKALSACLVSLVQKRGMTLFITEHRLDRLGSLKGRYLVLNRGRLIYDGFPDAAMAGILERDDVLLPPEDECRPVGRNMRRETESDLGGNCSPGLHLSGVTYQYPGSAAPVLNAVDLRVRPSEITVLVGANGSGKSTLLRLLNGLIKPDSGEVMVDGRSIAGSTVAQISQTVGVLFQHADYQLFAETIADELAFGPKNFRVPAPEINRRIKQVLADLNLGSLRLTAPPLALSVGEKQRVAIAGLLMMESPILVMDEPTLGLDWTLKLKLARVLRLLGDAGRTVLVVTHDRAFVRLCADRVVTLTGGRIQEVTDGIGA